MTSDSYEEDEILTAALAKQQM